MAEQDGQVSNTTTRLENDRNLYCQISSDVFMDKADKHIPFLPWKADKRLA